VNRISAEPMIDHGDQGCGENIIQAPAKIATLSAK
jgi:hypothetical protein